MATKEELTQLFKDYDSKTISLEEISNRLKYILIDLRQSNAVSGEEVEDFRELSISLETNIKRYEIAERHKRRNISLTNEDLTAEDGLKNIIEEIRDTLKVHPSDYAKTQTPSTAKLEKSGEDEVEKELLLIQKSTNKLSTESIDQAAAVCYRQNNGKIDFLLILTSGRRWMFPKGKPEAEEPLWRTAEREAHEEAGASGKISHQILTIFRHLKRDLKQHGRELIVAAFLLEVDRTYKPNEEHRNPTWFTQEEAIRALSEGRDFIYAEELKKVVMEASSIITQGIVPEPEYKDEKSIEFLPSTTCAGFVGLTERGPIHSRLVTSWTEYKIIYGNEIDSSISFLPHSIKGFFKNGGCRAYIVRIVGKEASIAKLNLAPNLYIEALNPGIWGNRIYVKVRKGTRTGYRVTINYYGKDPPINLMDSKDVSAQTNENLPNPDIHEDHDNLTFEPEGPNYALSVINQDSNLVRLESGDDKPVQLSPINNFIPLKGGSDGFKPSTKDYIGNTSQNEASSGLSALEEIDDIALLCVPDHVHPALKPADQQEIFNAMIDQCQRLHNRFAILSVRANESDVTAIESPPDTSYAAMYYPWIMVFDSYIKSNILIPAIGHIAGIYAQNDARHGIHKAPINIQIKGIIQNSEDNLLSPLEFSVSLEQQNILNRKGINAIRNFGREMDDIRLATAYTMSLGKEWKYINSRRFGLYLLNSIINGTKWVIFERNEEKTWTEVRNQIAEFLTKTWKEKALVGDTPEKAFFVRCDRTTMTQSDIDNGRLICLIGAYLVDPPMSSIMFHLKQQTATNLLASTITDPEEKSDTKLASTSLYFSADGLTWNISEEKSNTKLGNTYSLVIRLIDDYTEKEPIGKINLNIEKGKIKDTWKRGGFFHLIFQTSNQYYSVHIDSDFYFSETIVVDTFKLKDSRNSIAKVECIIRPKPSYPFPNNTTLIRGTLIGLVNRYSSAVIKVVEIPIRTVTDENGDFVLYFKKIKKGDITIKIEKNAIRKTKKTKIEKGKTISLGIIPFP